MMAGKNLKLPSALTGRIIFAFSEPTTKKNLSINNLKKKKKSF